jgi:protein gp37
MPEPLNLTLYTHTGAPALYPAPRGKATFNQSTGDGVSWAAYTWNPLTGCLHGCDYCLTPDTPVLMADMSWRPIGEIKPGDEVLGFDELSPQYVERRWRTAEVTDVWRTTQRAHRVTFDDGRQVVASAEHKWLCTRQKWRTTADLLPGDHVRAVFAATSPRTSDDYQAGYIAGITLGDGTFRWHPDWRSDKLGFPQSYWRVAVLESDRAILDRLREYLAHAGVNVNVRTFDGGTAGYPGRNPMAKVETRRLANMPIIAGLCAERDTDDWWAGWLGGMFDAEGGVSGGSLRIFQKDVAVLNTAVTAAERLGFLLKLEEFPLTTPGVRIVGDVVEQARFIASVTPALARKVPGLPGMKVRTDTATVVSVDRSVDVEMVDITTTTGTFVADGLLTHNCYARAIAKRWTDAFPAGFTPLFHPERLDAPANTRIPAKHIADPAWRRVFVVSMGDMFGRWVPLEWIEAILAAELASPQWQYLHLTKFPDRYPGLTLPAGAWVGTSVDEQNRVRIAERAMRAVTGDRLIKWLSLEPLNADLKFADVSMFDWIVIGAQTRTVQPGGAVPAFAPPAEWVLRITDQAREAGVPVHWKPNLRANPGVAGDLGPVWYDQYPAGVAA